MNLKALVLLISISPLAASAFSTSQYTLPQHRSSVVRHSNNEICVMSKIPSIGSFQVSKKDIKQEKKLCALDHYQKNPTCEKLWSSFPAVEYFKPVAGQTKSDSEKKCSKKAGQKNTLDKLAKYKYGTSCSRTSSILGYYHISRILGIKHIPASVIRTMDLKTHKDYAVRGKRKAAIPNYEELIAKTWRGLHSTLHKDPLSNRRAKLVVSQDSSHSYGALSRNLKGEHFYGRPFYYGSGGGRGVKSFAQNSSAYKDLRNRAAVDRIVKTERRSSNYQRIQQMKDAADLIVLDTIFGQKDRIGNLHFIDHFLYSKDGGRTLKKKSLNSTLSEMKKDPQLKRELDKISKTYARKSKSNKKKKRLKRLEKARAYLASKYGKVSQAKHMVLKDNDCGLKGGTAWKSHKFVEKIAHINQKTYTQLMALYAYMQTPQSTKYLQHELTMYSSEIREFRDNLTYVARSLNKRCHAGILKTDLNVKKHFLRERQISSCGVKL